MQKAYKIKYRYTIRVTKNQGGDIISKHVISKRAICPFYLHEDQQLIYCEGIEDGNVIHLAFDSKIKAKQYKEKYCYCMNYENCKVTFAYPY